MTTVIPDDLACILRTLADHAEMCMKSSNIEMVRVESNWTMLADYVIRGYQSLQPDGTCTLRMPDGAWLSFVNDGSGFLKLVGPRGETIN